MWLWLKMADTEDGTLAPTSAFTPPALSVLSLCVYEPNLLAAPPAPQVPEPRPLPWWFSDLSWLISVSLKASRVNTSARTDSL